MLEMENMRLLMWRTELRSVHLRAGLVLYNYYIYIHVALIGTKITCRVLNRFMLCSSSKVVHFLWQGLSMICSGCSGIVQKDEVAWIVLEYNCVLHNEVWLVIWSMNVYIVWNMANTCQCRVHSMKIMFLLSAPDSARYYKIEKTSKRYMSAHRET